MSAPHRPGMASIADRGQPDLLLGDHPPQRGAGDELPLRLRVGLSGALGLEGEVALPSAARRPGPGERVLTVTPAGPTSWARVEVSPMHRHLRRGVGRAAGQRPLARHRGQVDDVAAAPLDHRRQERAAHQEHPADVDREDLVPVVDGDVGQRCDRPGDPGVVDQDRHLARRPVRSASAATDACVGDVARSRPARPVRSRPRPRRSFARRRGRPGRPGRRRRRARARSRARARCRRR